jgi:hypothetical protein
MVDVRAIRASMEGVYEMQGIVRELDNGVALPHREEAGAAVVSYTGQASPRQHISQNCHS